MSIVKILIPLDGSTLAEKALTYVHLLKPVGDLRVRLISALDTYEGMEIGGTYEEWQEMQAERASALSSYLQGQVIHLAEQGIVAESDVCHGAAAPDILTDAKEFGADLILISSHGRSGLTRWRIGSVADKVIRGAECNTLVIGPHLREGYAEHPIRSVLVPLDGSALAEQALPLGERYANALGATLHLAQAVHYPVSADGLSGFTYSPDLFEQILEGANIYLANRAARSGVAKTQARVLEGYASQALHDYINKNSIDLVVMTSHGRSGLIRTALGSVTDRLIGTAAPVLVVQAKPVLVSDGRAE